MEQIHIKERDNDILIYLDSDNIVCYSNHNVNIYDYFKMFKLSNNYTFLGKYKDYDILLDNESGLKHYIKDGIDNIRLLFLNNGESSIRYRSKKTRKSQYKNFRFNHIVVCISLLGLIISSTYFIHEYTPLNNKVISFEITKDYKPEDLRDMIYSSPNLMDDEKDYLYNEDFLSDVLDTINDSDYLKNKLKRRFYNITIINENEEFDEDDNTYGLYNPYTPNTLYIKNYDEIDNVKKNVISHEYVHLCQETNGYNFIIEACAEIISNEYFSFSYVEAYVTPVRLVKKLMETIGSDVIWDYCFRGDFSVIEKRVRPYLTDIEYKEFLNDLTLDYENVDDNQAKYESLDRLIAILYKNIYKDDIENNLIISMIDNKDERLHRIYFNKRKESYYFSKDSGSYQTISYKEAMNDGVILVYVSKKDPISKEEAFELIKNHDNHIGREIDFQSADITIFKSTIAPSGYIISAIINGVRYDNVNLDDLVKDGIINVNYFKSYSKVLTYEDYATHNYWEDADLKVYKKDDTTLTEDGVVAYMMDKVFIDDVNALFKSRENKALVLNTY